jgi:hypothetical protein
VVGLRRRINTKAKTIKAIATTAKPMIKITLGPAAAEPSTAEPRASIGLAWPILIAQVTVLPLSVPLCEVTLPGKVIDQVKSTALPSIPKVAISPPEVSRSPSTTYSLPSRLIVKSPISDSPAGSFISAMSTPLAVIFLPVRPSCE